MTHQNRHWQWANAGLAMDLEPYIERSGFDLKLLPPGSLDLYRDPEGRITGIPIFIAISIMMYNKDLFDKMGVSYPDESWALHEDVVDAARKITQDVSGDGIPEVWGMEPGRLSNFFWRLWGQHYATPSRDAFALNNPTGYESLQFMRDLVT